MVPVVTRHGRCRELMVLGTELWRMVEELMEELEDLVVYGTLMVEEIMAWGTYYGS